MVYSCRDKMNKTVRGTLAGPRACNERIILRQGPWGGAVRRLSRAGAGVAKMAKSDDPSPVLGSPEKGMREQRTKKFIGVRTGNLKDWTRL